VPSETPVEPRIAVARKLRRTSTDAERRLWSMLRAHRFSKWKFRRQHPIGRYVADFACPAAMLVIELDGSHHAMRTVRDAERTDDLARTGWRVIRFWNGDVLGNRNSVAETIWSALVPK
jgi:very-short-patch-repair endonuclease